MTTVYTADKDSYGTGFFEIFPSLEELKRAIVAQQLRFTDYTPDMYTEELFQKHSKDGAYTLYEIHLHDDEKIVFSEYDGQSHFDIVKKNKNILSTQRIL
jgi:hypothetical protein